MSWSRLEQEAMLAAAALALAACGLLLVIRRPAPPIQVIEAPPSRGLVVQIDGAVARPGVYRLPPGSRLADALAAAGGLREDADASGVNRARQLRDGERVSVPSAAQTAAAHTPAAPGPGSGGLVDLNSATATVLETLPGIGPVLARRIVEHRAFRGGFQRLEDLLQVRGVGPRLLDGLRGRVVIR